MQKVQRDRAVAVLKAREECVEKAKEAPSGWPSTVTPGEGWAPPLHGPWTREQQPGPSKPIAALPPAPLRPCPRMAGSSSRRVASMGAVEIRKLYVDEPMTVKPALRKGPKSSQTWQVGDYEPEKTISDPLMSAMPLLGSVDRAVLGNSTTGHLL